MALAELQAAVARLCTDPAARAQLRDVPAAFARAAALNPAELAALTGAAAPSLAAFAQSLIRKRTREAAHAIPLTRAALDAAFDPTFAEFAAQNAAARDPALDALGFLTWLHRKPKHTRALLAAVRYEAAWIEMRREQKWWRLGIFHLAGTRPFLAVWWRFPGRAGCGYRQWPNPEKSRLPSAA